MSALSETLWVLQSNRLGPAGAHDFFKLTSFLDAQGTPYKEFPYRPFDDAPVVVEWDGPVVFYGGTTFIEKVHKQGEWRPGVWYDKAAFSFEALLGGYGSALLNADSRVISLGSLITEALPADALFFIRPADDLKEFVGGIRTYAEIQRDLLVQSSMSRATLETRVQLAPVKRIKREWRTILVDGKVIEGSQYRDGSYLLKRGESPKLSAEVVAFAEQQAAKYSPAAVYALDVVEHEGPLKDGHGGPLGIVETNCFNCAGWYDSNVRTIAREVTLCASRYSP